MLIDSNIIIYASQPEYGSLRQFIAKHGPFVSIVSYIEVLGFGQLDDGERALLERFFTVSTMLPLTDAITHNAIGLRRIHRISLGDSIIASTALVHNLTLVTRNKSDFHHIHGLTVLDPLESNEYEEPV